MLVLKVLDSENRPKYAGRAFSYKVGKKYRLNTENAGIVLCVRGYHFVEPGHLTDWYSVGSRVFIARVGGVIKHSSNKGAASEIKLLKEVTHLFKGVGESRYGFTKAENKFINTVGNAALELAKQEFGNE